MTDEEVGELGCPKVTAGDVQVLTIVLTSAEPKHDIQFKVYYPDASVAQHLQASLASLGTLLGNLQYFLLQHGVHHATNGNCPIGHGYQIVVSFCSLKRFQTDSTMIRQRLEKCGVSLEPHNWVTRDKYVKHADGSPLCTSHTSTLGVSSFPGASSSLVGTIGHDIVAAECRLKLDSDCWLVQKHAHNDGTIAKLLCSGYRITLN